MCNFLRLPTRRPRLVQHGKPWESAFSRKSQNEKKAIIQKPWHFPMAAQNLAAIEIQRSMRGFSCRCSLHGVPRLVSSTVRRSQLDKFLDSLQTMSKGENKENDEPGFQTWCASRIQAWWKMLKPRRDYQRTRFSMYHIAAMQVQYSWRNYCQYKYINLHKPSPQTAAAAVIQRAWRRYTNLRIYHYYRDLITFRNTGNPAMLLRAINPKEAGLIDPAAGVHVRFRLGGHLFPPTIYYKIFTHNPLCDIGAFAPRDYTQTRRNPADLEGLHNKEQSECTLGKYGGGTIRVGSSEFNTTAVPDDQTGWYIRRENNGWRPVTVKVLLEADKDPITKETANRQYKFHYSRQQRRSEVALRRKQQKRNWLLKMYREGLAAEKKQTTREGKEEDKVSDADLMDSADEDELLQWSEGLDYDKYVENWQALATSGVSDAKSISDPSMQRGLHK